jgi:pilus assembly protein Flp/PilA
MLTPLRVESMPPGTVAGCRKDVGCRSERRGDTVGRQQSGSFRANARLISQKGVIVRPSPRQMQVHPQGYPSMAGRIAVGEGHNREQLTFNGSRQPSRAWPQGQDRESEDAMKSLATKVQRFLVSEDGPTAVEYAVMLALIVIVCLTAIRSIGTNANTTFETVATELSGS